MRITGNSTGNTLVLLLASFLVSACGGDEAPTSSPVTIPTPPPAPAPAPAPTPPPPPAPTPTPTAYDRDVKVLFVGGSITLGAANPSGAWSSDTVGWMRTKYRSVEVKDISTPGIGALFATYRFENDVGTFRPDIAFIEYAVNDAGGSKAFQYAYTDALIYKLRRLNPDVIIIYVATTQGGDSAKRLAGEVPDHVRHLKEVTEENSGFFIDAGARLWSEIRSNGRPVTSYLPDQVHPNAEGIRVYFEAVRDALDAYLPTARGTGNVSSAYINRSFLDTARLIPSTSATGCRVEAVSTTTFLSGYLTSSLVCRPGEQFTLDFTGTSLGFIKGTTLDSAELACQVDGGTVRNSGFRLGFATDQATPFPDLLYDSDLSNGAHRLTCTVPATSPAGSRVIIGGFLASSAARLVF